jgi:glycosyltransferase involved in cell wall biosynthesis
MGPDIGIFFGRPVRSQMLAEELRTQGLSVAIYNNEGTPGTYTHTPLSCFPALYRLFSTHHQIYLTSSCFLPAFSLYLNWRARGLPYVFNAVGLMAPTYRERSGRRLLGPVAEHWLYPALLHRIFGGARAIVCNSQYLQRRLAAEFPPMAPKMLTIYNGIEFDRFASGKPIARHDTPVHAAHLLAVMTWDHERKSAGARLLIDAMGLITEKIPEARLTIAASVNHRGYARTIEEDLAARPWSASINILYNQTNIPDLLASSDLFVYATPAESNDSLPRALLEAHAAALPIVTTATAGCPEVVEDSATGFLVPYDPQALAMRVLELLADPNRRRAMGKLGQAHVRTQFSWQQMGSAYARLFRQLIASGGPPVPVDTV